MKNLIIAPIFLFILIGTGCLTLDTTDRTIKEGPSFPMTISDNQEINISINSKPMRIVSLAPSNTEILFSLGLEERISGLTAFDDYPPETSEKEKIGSFKDINIEKVVSLDPDLILGTGGIQKEIVDKFRDLGLTVVVMDAKNIDDIMENILLIGKITDTQKEAEALVSNLEMRVEVVREKALKIDKRPRVTYLLWRDPLIVAGEETFIEDLIILAGGENIYNDSGLNYPMISIESMVDRDPEIIINGDHKEIELQGLLSEPGWLELSAVKNNRLYSIDPDLVNRQGPRIVDALELFSEWISTE